MVVLIIIPKLKESSHLDAKHLLLFIVVLQYVPRLVRIIPLYLEVTKSAGIITETAWAGAAFNLLLYMLASHVSPNSALYIVLFNCSVLNNMYEKISLLFYVFCMEFCFY